MTVLTTEQIRSRLIDPTLENRLIITPILDPSTQLKKGDVSIDVRLGRAFAVPRPWSHSAMEDVSDALHGALVEHIVLDYGQPFVLHPHQFVLARTLEVMRLPADLMAYVVGRSSWGRRGLTVATATAVHPRFHGPITLELKNVGEVPISLYTFDRVAQLVFHSVASDVPRRAEGEDITKEEPQMRGAETVASEPANQKDRAHNPLARQFSFGFVPGLGQARDETTRTKIVALTEGRRRASLASRGSPPVASANPPVVTPPNAPGAERTPLRSSATVDGTTLAEGAATPSETLPRQADQ